MALAVSEALAEGRNATSRSTPLCVRKLEVSTGGPDAEPRCASMNSEPPPPASRLSSSLAPLKTNGLVVRVAASAVPHKDVSDLYEKSEWQGNKC